MLLERLTESDWVTISWLIGHLWLNVLVVLGTAGAYAVAHGFIPSLVYTGDISPEDARRMRIPLYSVMVVGIIFMTIIVTSAVIIAIDLLPAMYPRIVI